MIRSKIISSGSYLPENIVTNNDLSKKIDTSDEWIKQRTGIEQRHIAADGETTSDMAVKATIKALEVAGLKGSDIDAVIVATTTPDTTFPSVAVTVQDKIGMGDIGFGFDIQAVCSGFVYALSVADNFIKAGQVKRVVVIGAEKLSSILDWNDRATCVLFGDGAGAVILEADENAKENEGILSTHLHSEGGKRDILYTDGGVSTTKTAGIIKMNGKEVFKHAVIRMSEVVIETLEANNMQSADIDWLVPHQANERIINSTADKLKIPKEKIVFTVQKHGNTSAASIPLALDSAIKDKRIQKGDLILMETMGGGLTWGAALVRL